MQISNVKQREFWQERNEPAKIKGFLAESVCLR